MKTLNYMMYVICDISGHVIFAKLLH